MDKQQTSNIRINPQLIKKIKKILQDEPNADQNKVTQKIVEDSSIRLKKEVIKFGVNEYFKKNVRKSQENGQKNENNNTLKNGAIDLTIQNVKKKVKKNQATYEFEDNQMYKFENMGGIQELKEQIDLSLFQYVNNKSIYNQISSFPLNKGFLISGSVGSGKTLLANCILSQLTKKQYSCYFINAFELTGNDADQKIKKIFQLMEQKSPSVLCIDNLQQICSKQANKRSQGNSLSTLCLYIDRSIQKQFLFLATTSSPQKLDALTKPGKFYKSFKLLNPTQQQRLQILTKKLKKCKNSMQEKQITQAIKLTSGYVAVDIVSLLQEAIGKCVKRINENKQSQKVLKFQDFLNASRQVQPVLKRQGFAKIPTTKLSDIGALEHIKQALINQIILPMKSRQKFKKLNFQINGGGVLLYGPPGCGKTMLAKGIANEANVNFITVKGPQLLTKYVGESEEAVRKVFQRARSSAPSVIFFDQFDAIAPKRQDSGNQVTQRVVNTLLNQLNGIDDRKMIFVIAATNRPDIIDEAVLRSGRIQLKLQVPMPNINDRYKILEKITQKVGKEEAIDIKAIAQSTEGFSGADLTYLVKKSIISAVASDREGIRTKDMFEAIQSFRKDNVFSKKPETIVEQQQQEGKEFAYHPEEQLRPRRIGNNQKQAVDNELQNNIKKRQNPEGILQEFISFLVHKSKTNKNKEK